jgi:hypothetical protein
MRKTGLAAVGYFYVDFQDTAKQDARGLLSSLLDQLCAQSKPFLDILSDLHTSHNQGGERPSEAALTNCLRRMLEHRDKTPVFIVVDALDECPDTRGPDTLPGAPTRRQSVLKILEGLIRPKLQNLHICLTSRHEVDIQDVLDPLGPMSVSLHNQKGQHEDIAEYVKSVVDSDVAMKRWPSVTKSSVIDTLANKGM